LIYETVIGLKKGQDFRYFKWFKTSIVKYFYSHLKAFFSLI
jgi:hypothetical protein